MTTKKTTKKPTKIWVEVEVNKFTEGITVFRGQVSPKQLDQWANGELVDCSLKLENTYWYMEDKICFLGKGDQMTKQYTGDAYLRVDTIMALFVLRDSSYPVAKAASADDNIFPFPGREPNK